MIKYYISLDPRLKAQKNFNNRVNVRECEKLEDIEFDEGYIALLPLGEFINIDATPISKMKMFSNSRLSTSEDKSYKLYVRNIPTRQLRIYGTIWINKELFEKYKIRAEELNDKAKNDV